jgi:hypothetical protein
MFGGIEMLCWKILRSPKLGDGEHQSSSPIRRSGELWCCVENIEARSFSGEAHHLGVPPEAMLEKCPFEVFHFTFERGIECVEGETSEAEVPKHRSPEALKKYRSRVHQFDIRGNWNVLKEKPLKPKF